MMRRISIDRIKATYIIIDTSKVGVGGEAGGRGSP